MSLTCYAYSKVMKKYLKIVLLSIWLIFPLISLAQFFDTTNMAVDPSSNVNLITSPFYPEPNQAVKVSLDAYSIDTNNASISWYLDGIEQTEYKNLRSMEFGSKGLGESTNLTVNLRLNDGSVISKTRTITPSRVDIVIEADTLVPPFYKGRALPSVGSTINAIALPQTGNSANTSAYSYLWRLNNKTILGGSIKGDNVATMVLGLKKRQLLSVDVISQQGETIGSKTIELQLADPELLFYEENPLRGMKEIALQSPFALVGEETTLRAEPYYMDSKIFTNDPLLEWRINGSVVENPSSDPQYLTLRKEAAQGQAKIEFHIRNLRELLQGVRGDFTIKF